MRSDRLLTLFYLYHSILVLHLMKDEDRIIHIILIASRSAFLSQSVVSIRKNGLLRK